MKSFTLIIALLFASGVYAQDVNARLDSALKPQGHDDFLMGNLLVAEKGKVVYQRSFGYRDIHAKVLNDPRSAFALASVSKQFTSAAIIQLKEKGKLRLDDPLVRYFQDFPFRDITIRQLLTHTSGLPDYELFDEMIQKQPERIFTNKDIIPALKLWRKGLQFKPGAGWSYSNMNYCLLALLVEQLSGETLSGYLTKNIFKPAGMQHTYLENLLIKRDDPSQVRNYEDTAYYAGKLVPVDSIPGEHQMIFNLGGFYGQGGLTSTAEDLLRFDNAFFSGKLISTADLDEALTQVKLNNGQTAHVRDSFGDLGASGYGMGWFILADSTKGKIVWHTGGRPGVSTVHLHNLRTDQTVIMLENAPENWIPIAVCAYHLLNGEAVRAPGIPIIRLYAKALVDEGPDAAAARLQYLRDNPVYQMPDAETWVNLGYQLFAKKSYVLLAVEELKTASLTLPDNWYINQAYAAALELAGKKDLAILLYKKCIAENPNAEYARERLKALQMK